VLSRTSIVVAALGIGVAAIAWSIRRPDLRACVLAFALGGALGMSPLPVREAIAIGRPNIDLITRTDDFVPAPSGFSARAGYYGRRVVFALGVTPVLAPGYRIRVHWIAIWACALGSVVTMIAKRRAPTVIDACVMLFLVLYLAPVVTVAGIENYGGRMVAVAMPFAAWLAAGLFNAKSK
jgi:hypothetical protein